MPTAAAAATPQPTNALRVPYALSVHGDEEIQAVIRVLKTSTLPGENVRKLEEQVARLLGKKRGVMVNSGTSALILAIAALKLPEGSEIITPALTFSSTVAAIVHNRLVPSFVDSTPGTYAIDVTKIEAMITPNTKAMVIPNLLGNPPDWDVLRQIADKHKLMLIEDCADSVDVRLRGRPTGERAHLSITSFYGAHIINGAGNGGLVAMDTEEHEGTARILRGWGRRSAIFRESEDIESRFGYMLDGEIPYDAKFVFDAIGFNFEPSEVGAAYGLEQVKKLPNFIKSRNDHFYAHVNFFKKYEEFFTLPSSLPDTYFAWYAFPLTLKPKAPFTRSEMQIALEKAGIQTRPVFAGNILRQPGFKAIARRECAKGYPIADDVTRGGIVLGCHQGLTQQQMDHVHDTAAAFLKAYA